MTFRNQLKIISSNTIVRKSVSSHIRYYFRVSGVAYQDTRGEGRTLPEILMPLWKVRLVP